MEFLVCAGKFAKAIRPAVRVATANQQESDQDILNRCTIVAQKSHLVVAGFSICQYISLRIDNDNYDCLIYRCEKKGAATVNAQEFLAILESFPAAKQLRISTNGKNLAIEPSSCGGGDVQELPLDQTVSPFATVHNSNKTAKIRREVFIQAIDNVAWAMGTNKTMRYYMCLFITVEKGKVRFAAGDGGRFVLYEVGGERVTGAIHKDVFILPRNSISILSAVLQKATSDYITIRDGFIRLDEQSVSEKQSIIVTADHIELMLLNIDADLKQPDFDSVIHHVYQLSVSTSTPQWEYAAQGMSIGTAKGDSVFDAKVTADFIKGYFTVERCNGQAAKRRIAFTLTKVKGATSKGRKCPWFCCRTDYLLDLAKCARRSLEAIICFEDQEALVGNVNEKPSPVVVYFPQRANALGIEEKLCFFFATVMPELEKANEQ